MVSTHHRRNKFFSIIAGIFVGLLSLILTVGIGWAAPAAQDSSDPASVGDETCKECHLDITESWTKSPHAHAFDDHVFQQQWDGLGNPSDCLLCHTTDYQATENSYSAKGVSCEACHGEIKTDHPPAVVPIRADTDYCGTCHTTTLHEWRLTGHAGADVGCTDCHDPHSQDQLFKVDDEMCINCHKGDMEDYLEDLHVQKNIGCVDCHALVIPPEIPPSDGIVPTGHTFTITPETCVACHTDTLHAGFSLPGFENGASMANTGQEGVQQTGETELIGSDVLPVETGLTPEQRIQALEAALASNRMAILFQGGVIGLVLGATTAWFVARNTRRSASQDSDDQSSD